MDSEKTSFERHLQLGTSTITGLVGLFTALNSLSETVQKFFGVFVGFAK
jgi:hypothetical protein